MTSGPGLAHFFVALLPPVAVQEEITAIQQEIWRRFGSQGALNSPPHITLQPPFHWAEGRVSELERVLAAFARGRSPVPVQLKNFSAFAPRVIYVDVVQTETLTALQLALMAHLETTCGIVDAVAKGRPQFVPHATVGFRDLTREAFHDAWAEFQDRPFVAEFVVPQITLMRHGGQSGDRLNRFPGRQNWQIFSEFRLNA
ncbi:MAG: 2'-5' RNA ligase family protein [Nodosilinea sp.]